MELPQSWEFIAVKERSKNYFKHLEAALNKAYVAQETLVFPSRAAVFNAFKHCSFEATRVVILGQDPYPTKGHANGLCFSVQPECIKLPKSLQNILKERATDLGVDPLENGDLVHWAKQGVLMLNSVLTVEEGKPGSHREFGWEQFTSAVIQALSAQKTGLVFILWGAYAQSKTALISAENNLILSAPHPSPLSAYRGFFGSKPFSKTNAYLRQKGFAEIQW